MPKITFRGSSHELGEKVKGIIASDRKIAIRISLQFYDPVDQSYKTMKGHHVSFDTGSSQFVMGLSDKIREWIKGSGEKREG
jgi:hypothetical protein